MVINDDFTVNAVYSFPTVSINNYVSSRNVDYKTILSEIEKSAYDRYIGLEYRATVKDTETFDFLREVKKYV